MGPARTINTAGVDAAPFRLACNGAHRARVGNTLFRCSPPKTARRDSGRLAVAGEIESDQVPTDAALADQASKKFVWERNWYPVAPIDSVDDAKPFAFALLGREFALWRGADGEWHAFEDRCPHRGAPLSHGTVTAEGALACTYHGWTFNGEGVCEHSPQAADPTALAKSSRARAAHFPVKAASGLLWLWPESGPDGWIHSAMKEPHLMDQCSTTDPATWVAGGWTFVDAPVGFVTSVENSFDPVHAPFLHRGLLAQPEDALPMRMQLRALNAGGFTVTHDAYVKRKQGMQGKRTFVPPCATLTEYEYPNGASEWAQVHIVPSRPGRCRYVSTFGYTAPEAAAPSLPLHKRLFKHLAPNLYTARIHLSMFQLNDQDILVLNHQDKVIRGRLGKWRELYHLPTTADVGVVAFRKWMETFGGGDVPWVGGAGEQPPRQEDLYDRWHRHTKNCLQCRTTYNRVRSLQRILNVAALALLLGAAGAGALGLFGAAIVGFALAGVSVLAVGGLEDVAASFLSSVPRKGSPGEPKLYDE